MWITAHHVDQDAFIGAGIDDTLTWVERIELTKDHNHFYYLNSFPSSTEEITDVAEGSKRTYRMSIYNLSLDPVPTRPFTEYPPKVGDTFINLSGLGFYRVIDYTYPNITVELVGSLSTE